MPDRPYTFPEWDAARDPGEQPTLNVLYNWTRPGPIHDELVSAGIIARVANRWIFNPGKWREHCERGQE